MHFPRENDRKKRGCTCNSVRKHHGFLGLAHFSRPRRGKQSLRLCGKPSAQAFAGSSPHPAPTFFLLPIFISHLFQKVVDARNSYAPTPEAVLLLRKLASRLKKQSGKKVYAYLPKEAKQTVDQIVAELAKSEGIAGLYKE